MLRIKPQELLTILKFRICTVIDKQNKCFVSHLFVLEDRPFSNNFSCKAIVMIFS